MKYLKAFFIVFWLILQGGLALVCVGAVFLALAFTLNQYSIIPGLLLLPGGFVLLRRTFSLLKKRHLALGTVFHEVRNTEGPDSYSIHFKTRNGQEISASTTFGARLFSNDSVGNQMLVLYDAEKPKEDLRKFSFVRIWLLPILTFWFAGLFLIVGIATWLSL